MQAPTDLTVTWESIHIPPPSGDAHAFYTTRLLPHPKLVAAFSLRDEAQLAQYAQAKTKPRNITYLPALDTDPRKQDAAKVLVSGGETSIKNQQQFPVGALYQAGHTFLVIWDYWFGREWAFPNTSMNNSKNFNLTTPKGSSHLLWQTHFQYAAPGTLALVDLRGNSPDWPNQATIPPTVKRYVSPERWCRAYWFLTPQAVVAGEDTGTWVTRAWWADEVQEPAELYPGGVRFYWPQAGEAIGKYLLEYATSQNEWQIPHVYDGGTPDSGLCVRLWGAKDDHACALPRTDDVHVPVDRGPLTGYVRNVGILRDVTEADVLALLEKPVR